MSDKTPKRTLDIVERRDGRRCVMGSPYAHRLVPQHRQGGAGGRANKHRPANVLWLDSIMNGRIESESHLANVARVLGVKISLHADPEQIPVFFARERSWFRLAGDGREIITALEALTMMHAFYGPGYFQWQRAAARAQWTTSPDASLKCAGLPAIVCGRGSAHVIRVETADTSDPSWDAVTCIACRHLIAEVES